MATQILTGSRGLYKTTGKGATVQGFTVVEDTCSHSKYLPVKLDFDQRPKVLVYMNLCTFADEGLKTNDFQGAS